MTTKKRSAATVLAMEFGWDLGDLRETRYQSTRTTGAVYIIGDEYYCCVPLGKKPYQGSRSEDRANPWDWKPVPSFFVQGEGYQVWKAEVEA